MTAWIAYSILTGALVAVAALGAEWILKSMKRPVRAVWMIAIALTVALSLTAPLRVNVRAPAGGAAIALDELPMAVAVEPTFYDRAVSYAYQLQQAVLAPVHAVTGVAAAADATASRAVLIAASLSAIVALLALAAVYRRSMNERSKWPSIRLLERAVRVTPNVGPAVLGLAPPEIVVPQWVLSRNQHEQRLILEHESEHVRANDPLLLMVASIAIACMPWNVAMWFMWSRLRLAVELDCDRRVLLRGVQKASYGELLVELSGRRPWMAPAIPAFSWGTSHLEQRLVAMTARPKRFRFVRRSASGLLIAGALLVATRAELPAAAALPARILTTPELAPISYSKADVVTQQDTITRKPAAKKPAPAVTKKPASAKPAVATRKEVTEPTEAKKVVSDSLIIRNGEVVTSGEQTRVPLLKSDVEEQPGSRVRVRGQSSIPVNANGPLIFIDGVLMKDGALELVNPNQIENIEVIKGQAAIGLYGPGAANGVISITMKRP